MLVETAFRSSKLKCFRWNGREGGERVKDHCMLLGKGLNDLDAFRTITLLNLSKMLKANRMQSDAFSPLKTF